MSDRPRASFIRTVIGRADTSDAIPTAPKFGGHRHDYNTMATAIMEAQGTVVQAQAELARRENSLLDAQRELEAAQTTLKALCCQFAVACKELAIRPEDIAS